MLCSKEQQRTMRSPVSGLIAIVCSRCCVAFVAVVVSARNSLAQTSINTEQGIVFRSGLRGPDAAENHQGASGMTIGDALALPTSS